MMENEALRAPAKQRLLFVEDNPSIRVLVTRQLEGDFEVEAVPEGESALRYATQTHYDVVLLDIHLGPGLDGEAVLQALRRLPGYATTPIFAVTAHALPEDRARFLEKGFDGYLSKPFTRVQLLEMFTTIRSLKHPPQDPTDALEKLLASCLHLGLIDRYEQTQDGLVVTKGIASFRLAKSQAHAVLNAMLRKVA